MNDLEIAEIEEAALYGTDVPAVARRVRHKRRRAVGAHYSPEQLGELWGLSADTVRRLFEREPDVLVIENGKRGKRRYRTLRIPQAVVDRVYRRLSNPAKV